MRQIELSLEADGMCRFVQKGYLTVDEINEVHHHHWLSLQ